MNEVLVVYRTSFATWKEKVELPNSTKPDKETAADALHEKLKIPRHVFEIDTVLDMKLGRAFTKMEYQNMSSDG